MRHPPDDDIRWADHLERVYDDVRPSIGQGSVADYIPALAEVDADQFALSVATVHGEVHSIGAADTPFSIQSISKIFMLALALRQHDTRLWERVGREPSGSAFNSIMQLEAERGIPRNPLINAGALVVTDSLVQSCGRDGPAGVLVRTLRELAGSPDIVVDERVAASERQWGDRNRSLTYFMRSFGVIENPAEEVLDAYFAQCAIAMDTADLARAGRFLANDGIDPESGERIAEHAQVNRINALMLTCGHYDMSGDFAWRVGLPGKSGVGGGILAIVPRVASIAVWSPALNDAGNSLVGTLALERLSERAGLNLF